jgi:hypothetical protein
VKQYLRHLVILGKTSYNNCEYDDNVSLLHKKDGSY